MSLEKNKESFEKWNSSVKIIKIINSILITLNDDKIPNKSDCTLLHVFLEYIHLFMGNISLIDKPNLIDDLELTDNDLIFKDNLKIGKTLASLINLKLQSENLKTKSLKNKCIRIYFKSDDLNVKKNPDLIRFRFLIDLICKSIDLNLSYIPNTKRISIYYEGYSFFENSNEDTNYTNFQNFLKICDKDSIKVKFLREPCNRLNYKGKFYQSYDCYCYKICNYRNCKAILYQEYIKKPRNIVEMVITPNLSGHRTIKCQKIITRENVMIMSNIEKK